MSGLGKLRAELLISTPAKQLDSYFYWGGRAEGRNLPNYIKLGFHLLSNGTFTIGSWNLINRFEGERPERANLTYEEMRSVFLKYVQLLKPGEIPALDHLIHYVVPEPKINEEALKRVQNIGMMQELAKAGFKLEDKPINLKPGPTHDWISVLYRPYVPVI